MAESTPSETQDEDDLDVLVRAAFDSAPIEEAPPEAPPPAEERYRLGREIGRGGQGIVYLADDLRLGRPVALKMLTQLHGTGGARLERFRREAQVASRLRHPGICPVYDSGTWQGVPFFTMPFLEGESLAVKLATAAWAKGEKPIREAVELLEKVAWALHAAHEAGVVHRDVKPANIHVTPEGEPVILDFGCARDAETGNAPVTRTGEVFGTPAYMSPEQRDPGGGFLDRRSDVWSLGAVLYECLTLRRPFEDGDLRTGRPPAPLPDPRRVRRDIPRDLVAVLEAAMEWDRDRRYPDARALAEDLRRVREREPVRARRAGPILRLLRWGQRNPGAAAAVVMLIIGLSVSLALLRESRQAWDAAEVHLVRWQQLADVGRVDHLVKAAEGDLWPARPNRVRSYLEWLAQAEELLRKLPAHRADLLRLRDRARTGSGEAWEFDSHQDQWRHDQQARLVALLERLGGEDRFGPTTASVRVRLESAATVRERSIDTHQAAWDEARDNVRADPRFPEFDMLPQMGLVPLGPDPRSKLQEFADLGSGTVPARDPETGRLRIDEGSGLVVVLVPGGRFLMGEQSQDSRAPNHHPAAKPLFGPVHEVMLDPYLISKFEMTQAQWERLTGDNPSATRTGMRYAQGLMTGPHPVENLTWGRANEVLRRSGFTLPTESQWECACRAGTTTAFSTGDDDDSLQGSANIADEDGKRFWGTQRPVTPGFHDGHLDHAPIGSFAPNAWGLHDVHGNVWEMCLDAGDYRHPPRPSDGLRTRSLEAHHVARGGGFLTTAANSRSGTRSFNRETYAFHDTGLRPLRPWDPDP